MWIKLKAWYDPGTFNVLQQVQSLYKIALDLCICYIELVSVYVCVCVVLG